MLHHKLPVTIMVVMTLAEVLQGNVFAPRQTTDVLGQLESMGVQVLSGILSPSTAASANSATSATFTPSSTSASTSASSTSSLSTSSTPPSTSFAVAESAASPTSSALSFADKENTRHRNIAIIVGSVLGAVVFLLFLVLLWFCITKRRRRNRTPMAAKSIDDDDELDPITSSGPGGMAYVTRIESWHEPRNSRNSSRGPPRGSTSRVSLVQRDVPERYNNGPAAPVPLPVPPRHRTSQYGLIQNEGPYEAPHTGYFDRPHRHSMDDGTRDPNRYPGYVPYRSTQSSTNLAERSPTPLFGSGKTPGEHSIKRKSVGSGPTTAVNSPPDSKDPSPQHANTNGPYIAPKNPSRRRESLPGSPLANEFDFGFNDQPRRLSRERMPGAWSNNSITDAHHRF